MQQILSDKYVYFMRYNPCIFIQRIYNLLLERELTHIIREWHEMVSVLIVL